MKTTSSSWEQGFASQSGLSRRSISSSTPAKPPPPPSGPLHLDIDPAPKPWPVAQFLAFAAIFLFAFLQFLPPTHFRYPYDPFHRWILFDSDSSFSSGFLDEENGNVALPELERSGTIHVISWMECLDLRMLSVLANSTLSNSRDPQRIHFHFFIPEGDRDKVSYYKLKVLFPDSDLEIIGQKEVEETLRSKIAGGLQQGLSVHSAAPFVISSIFPSSNKFLYISPDTIVKGRVEELFEVDLKEYAIAAPDDCSKSLDAYVNFDVLDAIQRAAANPWVSTKPYDKNACIPDLNVLLFDAKKAEPDLVEAILWWSRVLNLGNQRTEIRSAIVLALHGKTFKLPSEWKKNDVEEPVSGDGANNFISYDGPRKGCSGHENLEHDGQGSNLWKLYLPPSSNNIVSD